MTARFLAGTLFAASLTFVPPGNVAAQVPEAATFYLIVGNDTLVVERMTRLPNRLHFQLFDTKRLGKVDLTAELLPSALVSSVDVSFFKSERDTVPLQHTLVRLIGDSAGFVNDGVTTWLHVGKNAIPNVNPSASLLEQMLIRAKAIGGARAEMSFIYLPGGSGSPGDGHLEGSGLGARAVRGSHDAALGVADRPAARRRDPGAKRATLPRRGDSGCCAGAQELRCAGWRALYGPGSRRSYEERPQPYRDADAALERREEPCAGDRDDHRLGLSGSRRRNHRASQVRSLPRAGGHAGSPRNRGAAAR